jgi:signal transduction histidine kinase
MNQPTGDAHDEMRALQLTCDRLRQQIQFQAAFLGTASHELRAPINQIISLHQLILEDLCESPTEEREFIAQANQTIHRVLNNLDTLISLSKLDIGALQPKMQPVAIAPVLTTVQQLTEMKCINQHCRLILGPVAETLVVQSDRQWLQQILVTLVEAALAAESTFIHLATTAPTATNLALTLSCDATLDQWPDQPIAPLALAPTVHPPENVATDDLKLAVSPEFAYQMVVRMVHHLQGTITQDVSQLPAQRLVQMGFPQAIA